ncbi:MAG: hypothetical protein ACOX8E_02015 [Ruminococcus sp.]|jgi:hypothetical protein
MTNWKFTTYGIERGDFSYEKETVEIEDIPELADYLNDVYNGLIN